MSFNRMFLTCVLVVGALFVATPSQAQLADYSQDFESLGLPDADSAALTNDGWLVFGNVFDSGGGFLFNYGPFGAPNGGQAFSAVVAGEGGAEQGAQQLTIYSDYGCCGGPPPDVGHGNGTDLVESNVFQEQTVGSEDVGKTYQFVFDAKKGNINDGGGGNTDSTAIAFIKTLDPNAGFSVTNFITEDTTNLATTWDTFTLELVIDAGLVGQIFQIGFSNTSSDFASTGVVYDNISLTGVAAPMDGLEPYSQNFEGLNLPGAGAGALTNDGWLVFGNVFDSGGGFLFNYGPFGAPNGGEAFSAVVAGEGGAEQGAQQLSIYSDYSCCGGPPPDVGHGNGTDLVESNVFQEQTVGSADVGKTYQFVFDAKKGNINDGGGGNTDSTAIAFIKTLDPNAGFSVTNFITEDTTNLATTWDTFTLELVIDAGLVGQIFQIGFSNTSSAFASTGVFYDNINFGEASPPSECVVDDTLTGQIDPGTYEASNSITMQDATATLGTPGDEIVVDAPTVILDGSNAGVNVGGVFTASNVGCDPNGGGGDDNLAVNGSFENDYDGWEQFPSGTQMIVTDNVVEGVKAARLTNDVPASASLIKNANVGTGTVTAGQTIYLSFSARGALAAGGVTSAEFFSEVAGGGVSDTFGTGNLTLNPDPAVWTEYTFVFAAGSDVSGGVTLQLQAITGGDPSSLADVFFDDVCISVVADFCFTTGGGGDTEDIAVNGGFESGGFDPGWTVAGTGVQQVVSDNPANGSFAANLQIDGSAGAANSIIRSPNLALGSAVPDADFTLSFNLRGTAADGAVLFARVISEGTGISGDFGPLFPSADWPASPESFTGTLGANVDGGVTVQFTGQCGAVPTCDGDFYIDDVVLETTLSN